LDDELQKLKKNCNSSRYRRERQYLISKQTERGTGKRGGYTCKEEEKVGLASQKRKKELEGGRSFTLGEKQAKGKKMERLLGEGERSLNQ